MGGRETDGFGLKDGVLAGGIEPGVELGEGVSRVEVGAREGALLVLVGLTG